ncbi:MAG: diguanylate cyclase [Candidatus Hydrogenedentes bacterium]|nr:diguanylate cyclase [Candidatus Hydrogenedentota bacterium]
MSERPTSLVLLADNREDSGAKTTAMLTAAGFTANFVNDGQKALDAFFAQPPQCLVIRHGLSARGARSLLDAIKADNVYGHLPVVVIVSPEQIEVGIDWHHNPADDYVVEPFTGAELISRIRMCWARAQRDVNANPLTGLPGNLTISREAERRLKNGTPFAFGYLDIDGFKAFNDRYGFGRGDEAIRMTARILVNTIRSLESQETYVGHVGGDDFVFITPPHLMAQACERIIAAFELVATDFYDEEDRVRGYIQSVDRQGNPQQYSLMSCSIGAVDTISTQVSHIAELFSRVAEVKTFAKRLPGSNYIIDRRK